MTTDPFIVYTSNIFAILGLRAFYFVLSGAIAHIQYLRIGLSLVLVFVGAKMLLAPFYKIPILVSLGLIASVLAASVLVSLFFKPDNPSGPRSEGSPLRLARKIVVGLIGFTLLAVGAAMIVLPGPAVIVIPISLAILGSEFLWARRFLRQIKDGTSRWLKRRGKS